LTLKERRVRKYLSLKALEMFKLLTLLEPLKLMKKSDLRNFFSEQPEEKHSLSSKILSCLRKIAKGKLE
jgi:hypothetical protein